MVSKPIGCDTACGQLPVYRARERTSASGMMLAPLKRLLVGLNGRTARPMMIAPGTAGAVGEKCPIVARALTVAPHDFA